MGRVSEGKGQGSDSCTLDKPLPLAGVRGIPLKNPCLWQGSKICIYMYILSENSIFSIENLFLACTKTYYIESGSH